MNVSKRDLEGVAVVTLEGVIDGNTAPIAQEEILPLVGAGCKLALDMSQVEFMSSAGLRMMLVLFRRVSSSAGKILLAGLSEEIKDTMALTGFLDFFTTSDSLESGISALNG